MLIYPAPKLPYLLCMQHIVEMGINCFVSTEVEEKAWPETTGSRRKSRHKSWRERVLRNNPLCYFLSSPLLSSSSTSSSRSSCWLVSSWSWIRDVVSASMAGIISLHPRVQCIYYYLQTYPVISYILYFLLTIRSICSSQFDWALVRRHIGDTPFPG